MDYDDAIAYLDQHIDLERTPAVAGRLEGLSLDRMRALCDVLDNPQNAQPTIHLTGTNGKGSTARMISALLGAHDLTVGTYTSPHLERITERLSRNLEPIADEAFSAVIADIAAVEPLSGVEPSYFELLTAAAFSWFAHLPVSVAVVEVGLLGRWDATNVVDGSVAVLTNVGRDHTDFSGDWRRKIAEEKAGIVKPGSTFVVGEPDPSLRDVFDATPSARRWIRGEDFGCDASRLAVGGRVVDVFTPLGRVDEVFVPLHGSHQADNAAAAIAAVGAFFDRAPDTETVAGAFADLRVPGRFEVVHRAPLVVLDGAHNPDGAQAASATLADEFEIPGTRYFVLGVLAGRDPLAFVDALGVTPTDRVLTCMPPSPRGVPAADLAAALRAHGLDAEHGPSDGDVGAAVVAAFERTHDDDLVFVTGSLYTVGDARSACRELGLAV